MIGNISNKCLFSSDDFADLFRIMAIIFSGSRWVIRQTKFEHCGTACTGAGYLVWAARKLSVATTYTKIDSLTWDSYRLLL